MAGGSQPRSAVDVERQEVDGGAVLRRRVEATDATEAGRRNVAFDSRRFLEKEKIHVGRVAQHLAANQKGPGSNPERLF